MPINFTQIFKDSWNFMQNQKAIILKFIGLFFVIKVVSDQTIYSILPRSFEQSADLMVILSENYQQLFLVGLASSLVETLAAYWVLLTIHQLSHRQEPNLSQTFTTALKRMWGSILIYLIIILPFIISLVSMMITLLVMDDMPSIFLWVLFIIGIFVLIRFCLAPLHYVLQPVGIQKTFSHMWYMGKNKGFYLFIYFALIYLVAGVVENFLSPRGELILDILAWLLIAALRILMLIFSYRFYTQFIQTQTGIALKQY